MSAIKGVFPSLESASLSDQIARLIEDAVVRGTIVPGQRLSTDGLAREFKVSHIPVREALKQLEAVGLVVQEPNKGAKVVELSVQDIRHIFEVRRNLEGFAVSVAASRIDEAGKARLRRLVDEMGRATKSKDFGRLLAADKQFHETIWEATGNPFLVKMLATLLLPYFGYLASRGYQFHVRQNQPGYVPDVHQKVYQAIVRGESKEARRVLTEIHDQALRAMLQYQDGMSPDSSSQSRPRRKREGVKDANRIS